MWYIEVFSDIFWNLCGLSEHKTLFWCSCFSFSCHFGTIGWILEADIQCCLK